MRFTFLVALFVITGCSQIKVKTRANKNVDFNKYDTWCWFSGCDYNYEGPYYKEAEEKLDQMANAIAEEMQNKGYVQADDSADIMIDFEVVIKQDSSQFARVQEEDLPFWEEYENQEYYHYLRGTFNIYVIDPELGAVIWQSSSLRYISRFPEMNDEEINASIKKALKKLPKKK